MRHHVLPFENGDTAVKVSRTPGAHPYLVGLSEGRAVLDAIRAVRNVPEAHAGSRAVVWGHSQGGHATLFAGLLAQSYAPELHLVGVAAAAPASELHKLLGTVADTPDAQLFSALVLSSWSHVYNISLDKLVASSERPALETLARVCFDPPVDSDTQSPMRQCQTPVTRCSVPSPGHNRGRL